MNKSIKQLSFHIYSEQVGKTITRIFTKLLSKRKSQFSLTGTLVSLKALPLEPQNIERFLPAGLEFILLRTCRILSSISSFRISVVACKRANRECISTCKLQDFFCFFL